MSAYEAPAQTPIRSPGNHFTRKGQGDTTVIHAKPLDTPIYKDFDDYIETFYRDGYLVFKNAIPRDKVAEVRTIMESFNNGRKDGDYSSWGYSKTGERREDVRFLQKSGGGPCGHPGLLPYINIPIVMQILEYTLNKYFHIVGGTCWLTGPGRHPMGLHSDWKVISLPEDILADPRVRLPMYECFAHFYLNDITEETGPTIIVPGSHRSGRVPCGETSWNGAEVRSFCCEAGDMLLFTNDIWHGGLPNISDDVRYLYQVQYANMRIGTIHGKPLNIPDAVKEQANEEQKLLLGLSHPEEGGYY